MVRLFLESYYLFYIILEQHGRCGRLKDVVVRSLYNYLYNMLFRLFKYVA